MKAWLSYCVFTDSIMIEGLRTSFIPEGETYTRYLNCPLVSSEWPILPLFHFRIDQLLSSLAGMTAAEHFPIRLSQPASWLTGWSVCRVESPTSCSSSYTRHLEQEQLSKGCVLLSKAENVRDVAVLCFILTEGCRYIGFSKNSTFTHGSQH